MFSLLDIVKYLTFISYIGFIISSISGVSDLINKFDLCKCMISVLIMINVPIIIYVDIVNKNTDNMTIIHYIRSYIQFIISLLIIGLSHIGVGFGIYGITMCIANLLMGVFDCNDNINNPNNPVIINPKQNLNTPQNNIN